MFSRGDAVLDSFTQDQAAAAVDGASDRPHVRVIHSAVKGRARLEVNRLYRCEPVRRKVESELLSDPRIIRVSANILTGRVLILFNPECTIDEIAGLIEAMMRRSVPASGLQPSGKSRYPVFSSTAGATTDEGRVPQKQKRPMAGTARKRGIGSARDFKKLWSYPG
ncbi:MAG TPA: hypothetical protein VFI43_05420 [Nitrosospira sp.]|nr:hypothetical protein [Nitrosospira sp.]